MSLSMMVVHTEPHENLWVGLLWQIRHRTSILWRLSFICAKQDFWIWPLTIKKGVSQTYDTPSLLFWIHRTHVILHSQKQQHRTVQRNLSGLLSGLIASSADKGIYLSGAFIKKYENVDFVNFPFGDFVRDVYKVREWESPEPQGKHTAAPQQPNKSIST